MIELTQELDLAQDSLAINLGSPVVSLVKDASKKNTFQPLSPAQPVQLHKLH